jgi:hypothetical protein
MDRRAAPCLGVIPIRAGQAPASDVPVALDRLKAEILAACGCRMPLQADGSVLPFRNFLPSISSKHLPRK